MVPMHPDAPNAVMSYLVATSCLNNAKLNYANLSIIAIHIH